jgi:vacuolar-type H+-ATPase subunit E/Vma4
VTNVELDDEPAAIWGGVIVRRTDVRRMVDNSFNARLLLVQRQLRDQVYRRLCEHGKAPKES